MEFCYGIGTYTEGEKHLKGTITLGEHKLFLKDENGDLANSYVPLEKIERIKKTSKGLIVYVRPSLAYRYTALFSSDKKNIDELTKDLVQSRMLKKLFLKNEWVERSQ